jgi:YD repeat-containing protein
MEWITCGNLLKQSLPDNNDLDNRRNDDLECSYDAWGNVLSVTDQRGNMTYYEYNQRNQVGARGQAYRSCVECR